MICRLCKKEFTSTKVFRVHQKMCQATKTESDVHIRMDNPNMYKEMKFNELRELASVENIEIGKNPKKQELIDALEINKFGEVQPEV